MTEKCGDFSTDNAEKMKYPNWVRTTGEVNHVMRLTNIYLLHMKYVKHTILLMYIAWFVTIKSSSLSCPDFQLQYSDEG